MQILHTPRLSLRWFDAGDARFILKLLNEPSWLRFIGDRGVHTRRDAERWIAQRLVANYGHLGFGFWAVERRADAQLIGMCGLVQRDSLPEVDIGYALLPRHWGQGFAREAAAACLRYGHEVLGLERVWAITTPDNRASARVLKAIGLRDAGLRRLTGNEGATRLFTWAAPEPEGGDDARIEALVARMLSALRTADLPAAAPHPSGLAQPATLPALPHYFLPEATIQLATRAGRFESTSLHGFIAPRAELRHSGRLRGYDLREIDGHLQRRGAIAQRWLRYSRRGVLDCVPFESRGTLALQLVRTPRGWKIAAMARHDEAPPTPRR